MELEKISQQLSSYFSTKPVLRAYVFGSYASGSQTEKSDVDILVELDYEKGGASFDNWCTMQDDLAVMLNKHVDLVSANGLSTIIAPYIHSSKKLVYDHERSVAA